MKRCSVKYGGSCGATPYHAMVLNMHSVASMRGSPKAVSDDSLGRLAACQILLFRRASLPKLPLELPCRLPTRSPTIVCSPMMECAKRYWVSCLTPRSTSRTHHSYLPKDQAERLGRSSKCRAGTNKRLVQGMDRTRSDDLNIQFRSTVVETGRRGVGCLRERPRAKCPRCFPVWLDGDVAKKQNLGTVALKLGAIV
jgi:hypothetical protein